MKLRKYYVSNTLTDAVILATNPLDACIRTFKVYGTMTVGINWKMSERGFDIHLNDVFLGDDIIAETLRHLDAF